MHILVPGAAGFIAARTIERLLASGHRVTGLDNLNDAYDVRLKEWRLRQLAGRPGFEFIRADIPRPAELAAIWQAGPPIEAVINLAARGGGRPSGGDPPAYYETKLNGTMNLLELCRQPRVGK